MATVDFSSVPTNIDVSQQRINELGAGADRVFTSLKTVIEKATAEFERAKAAYTADSDRFIAGAEVSSRATVKQVSKAQLAQQLLVARRTVVQASNAERWALLKQLQAFDDEATAIGAVCASPLMLLGRFGLGDTRKTQLIEQLQGAGLVELESTARMGIMMGDTILLAAVVLVVDRMPRERRPFAVADLAQSVVGQQFKAIDDTLRSVHFLFKSALAANRAFETGSPNSVTNISLALSKRALSDGDTPGSTHA